MTLFLRFFVPFHIVVFRLTRGRVMGKFGLPVLLLTTTGRRTGMRRTAPLLYHEDRGATLVVASNNGGPNNPDWYHNLVANPIVEVETRAGRSGGAASPASRLRRTATRSTSRGRVGRSPSWRCARSPGSTAHRGLDAAKLRHDPAGWRGPSPATTYVGAIPGPPPPPPPRPVRSPRSPGWRAGARTSPVPSPPPTPRRARRG